MKKTLLTLGLFSALAASAQNVVTFDDLPLAPESHNDESDDNGSFVSGGVTFHNYYDTDYSYWASGFSYSNETNVTTPGYSNSYSSYAGGGAQGSANFAVYYPGIDMPVDFGTERMVSSVMLTNTTYAALSMKNGDSYGKVFGSPNNANGTPDGTNGEDFYFVRIIGLDADTLVTDTVVFYLADYRFADNTQDYIVNEWKNVDLSALGNVRFLAFELESSDVGSFGMNTPAYFAMDNLSFGTLGVNELTETFSMYPNPATDVVTISGNAGSVTVFDASGKVVYTGSSNGQLSIDTQNWTSGFYTVEVNSATGTGRSKLVKK